MKILIQFPTYKRPEKFVIVLNKYVDMSSGTNDLFFNINCDSNDASMKDLYIIERIKYILNKAAHISGTINYDQNTTKISAINSRIEDKEFDIVICASDDMTPMINDWDKYISDAMSEYFPDTFGCVHFNDGYTSGKLITFSILGKKLYEHFGYIYHPDYKSLYCDNEFTQEVTRLNAVKYIDKVVVKHEHYAEKDNANSGQYDEAAQKTLHYSGRDQYVFNERQRLGFPKERVTTD